MRVATWNVKHRGSVTAARLGALAREAQVDLMLLQAANPTSLDMFVTSAEFDWCVTSWNAGAPALTMPGRRRVAAIAGRGPQPVELGWLPELDRPERMVSAVLGSGTGRVVVASYHAPSGSAAGVKKVDCAKVLLSWVRSVEDPLVLGADANTPKVDHPDPDRARTHWPTGADKLQGGVGDDVMFGGRPAHHLEDAYRRFLNQNPGLLQDVAVHRPQGPLAVSHVSVNRLGNVQRPRRYDALWISRHFDVLHVDHDLDGALRAGTDHALVTVDLARKF